jgi:hypothetical protein
MFSFASKLLLSAIHKTIAQGTNVMIFEIFSHKNFGESVGVSDSKFSYFFQKNVSQHWLSRKTPFSAEKLSKIAENSVHNIDPFGRPLF